MEKFEFLHYSSGLPSNACVSNMDHDTPSVPKNPLYSGFLTSQSRRDRKDQLCWSAAEATGAYLNKPDGAKSGTKRSLSGGTRKKEEAKEMVKFLDIMGYESQYQRSQSTLPSATPTHSRPGFTQYVGGLVQRGVEVSREIRQCSERTMCISIVEEW